MEEEENKIRGDPPRVVDAVPTTTTSVVDRLPTELLVRVCGYLSVRERQSVRRVCKKLCQVVDDPLLWRTISMEGFACSDHRGLKALLARYHAITARVSLHGSFNLVGFAEELCTCTRLQSLKLTQSPCYVVNMASVVRALPSLAHLEFQPVNTSCGLGYCTHVMCRTREWQDFLDAVANLRSLTLLSQWDENFVEFLLRQWACLEYSPSHICLRTMHTQTAPLRDSVQSRYSSLQDLWKECMENFPPCEEVCQFRLTWQGSRLPLHDVPIFELNLDGSPLSLSTALRYTQPEASNGASLHGVISLSGKEESAEEEDERFRCGRYISSPEFVLSETETKFVHFEAVSGHLTCLSLTEANALSSANLKIFAHNCPNLSQLNLSGCKKCLNPLSGMATLASNCTRLQALNLQNIPCNFVERTSEMWTYLSQMESLRHLAIDPCLFQASQEADEFTGEQHSVSGDEHEIEESVKAMHYIQVLEIQTTLSADKSILCQHCRNLDSRQVEFVGHMRALRILRITGVSPAVCRILLKSAFQNCEYLRYLYINMEFSFSLPSEALKRSRIRKLAIQCPRFNVTDSLIAALASSATLTHTFFAVRSISKGSVKILLREFPELVVCHVYCRDGPVMQPPSDILQFRLSMQELSSSESRVNPLNFMFNEGSSYSGLTECTTTQSLTQAELVSWWN